MFEEDDGCETSGEAKAGSKECKESQMHALLLLGLALGNYRGKVEFSGDQTFPLFCGTLGDP